MLKTALVIDGNSEGGKRALAEMDRSLERTEENARDLAKAYSSVDVGADRLAASQARAQGGVQQMTKGVDAQRMGMQQLSMQLNDVATMFALGARPQQIFASQAGQVIQAVQLMNNGTSKLAGFLGGPWGMAITTATVVLAPFIGKLLETESAANRAREALQSMMSDYREFVAANGKLTEAQIALGKLRDRQTELETKIASRPKDGRGNAMFSYRDQQELIAVRQQILEGTAAITREMEKAAEKDGASTQRMIEARAKLAGATTVADRAQAQYSLSITQAQTAYDKSGKTAADQQRLLEARTAAELKLNQAQDAARANSGGRGEQRRIETLAREYAATNELIAGLFKLADAYSQSEAAAMRAEIEAKATEQGIKKRADVQQYVTQQLSLAIAQRIADGAKEVASISAENAARDRLNKLVASGAMTAEEASDQLEIEATLRPLIAARTLAEGDAKVRLSEIIMRLRVAMKNANDEEREAQDLAKARTIRDDTKQLEAEIALNNRLGKARLDALRGLNGHRLEDELARINYEHERGMIIVRAQAEYMQELAQGHYVAAAAALEHGRAELKAAEASFGFEKGEVAIERTNDRLRETIDLLQRIGGFGGILGDLLGIASGDLESIDGPLGYILNTGIKGQDGEIRKLGDIFKSALGEHAAIMVNALQNAGLGMAAGQAVFGKQGTAGQMAGAAGGILGGIGGSMLSGTVSSAIGGSLGAAIGSAMPVIGTIIGGIAGTAIMKMIGGADRGAAIISGGKVTGTYGDTQAFKDQATQAANGLLDTMQQIAGQFGATLDAQAMGKLSIGIRDGNFVLDPQGRGYTKTSQYPDLQSFGKDGEAAAAAAIKLMLERGAIEMREGSLKLIKEATDLQTGLQKALQFDQVMDALEGGSSQLVAQARALKSQFSQWISVMKEAGASVADLTRVQEMQAQRLNELIAQAGSSYRSTFYTDQQNVDFAKQTIAAALTPLGKQSIDTVAEYMAAVEAAQKDTSEAGLAWLDTLYQLSDEFAVLKQASDAAAAAAAAAAAQKEAERAAAAAAAKAEKERLAAEKARNIEAAKSDLRAAYERSAAERQATIDSMKASAGAIGDVMAQIMGTGDAGGTFDRAQALLRETAFKANVQGDQGAIAQLSGVLGDYWSAAQAQASSALELERMRAEALRIGQSGINSADAAAQLAKEAMEAEKAQVGLLIDLNEGVQTVAQAIAALAKLTGTAPTPGGGTTPTPTPTPGGNNGGTRPPRTGGTRPSRGHSLLDDWGDAGGFNDRLGELLDVTERQRQMFDRLIGPSGRMQVELPGEDEAE